MRIAVDSRSLNVPHVRGMGRYLCSLLEAADQQGRWEWELLSDRPDLPIHFPALRSARQMIFETRGWKFCTWEQWGLPRATRRLRADVLFCPNTTLPWWQPIPAVVTVHDTIPWDSSEEKGHPFYWRRVMPRALQKAAAIVVPSACSQRDLAALWPVLEKKIHVIPHGLSEIWREEAGQPAPRELEELGIHGPYFLYVGGEIPRKRMEWAIKIFEQVTDDDCQLLLCGLNAERRANIRQELPASIADRVVALPFVPEECMPRLVRQAVGVLYPTLYEGFGFPALEAQAVGTPILMSAVGSLAELCGPGAVVLPPEDLDAWIAACRELLADWKSDRAPNQAARAWATSFSWQESARRHLELLQSVAV
ncbi:MAG TPA: glycosyltransferase family 1 protein [Pirellulaceae bacterium]|nr:glycosyltransferase family 1 protein [Pirellulaceae bacterium]